jgi:dethiobiotin synthetase
MNHYTGNYFITGTDTGVGKTQVTSALIRVFVERGQRVIGMKPVASGCIETTAGRSNEDADLLVAASNVDVDYNLVCPYRFVPAIAPHLAALEAGIEINPDSIMGCYDRLCEQADRVLVEGVGGWAVPISADASMADIAVRMNLPVILVVGARLGCINHALLTQQSIADSGLTLAGWVYNRIDPSMEASDAVLKSLMPMIKAPLIADIPNIEQADLYGALDLMQLDDY